MTTTHPHSRSPGDALTPHARGLPGGGQAQRGVAGIIPACAGFTLGDGDGSHLDSGSSPHTRGLLFVRRRSSRSRRIIPAHAGFTPMSAPSRPGTPDHPRTRGVYFPMPRHKVRRRGSSPHTRGLPGPGVAGDRVPVDHPRTRGVYSLVIHVLREAGGSSPHTRGLPRQCFRYPPDLGIIPAHAGFTLGDPWNPNGPGVYHPPVSFTADLVPARRSCGSAAVEPRWTTTPWAA